MTSAGLLSTDGSGETYSLFASLRHALAPTPGRFGNTIRIVVLVLITATLSETFRIPEAGLSCFIVLLVSREQRAATIQTAFVSGVVALVALLLSIVVLMASLAEPGLRLPLFALFTFGTLFLARTARLGPILFVAGFIMAYALTFGDQVLGLALQPYDIGNTTSFAIPGLAFLPPEEALVHFLLWIALVVIMPAALVIVGNLLTGRDPTVMLRNALADRLLVAAEVCRDTPGSEQNLAALTWDGLTSLRQLNAMSRPVGRRETNEILIEKINRLSLFLLAAARLPRVDRPMDWLGALGQACRSAEIVIRRGGTMTEAPTQATQAGGTLGAGAQPLVAALGASMRAIVEVLQNPAGKSVPKKERSEAHGLLAKDALSDPRHVQFALKVTLAVMVCYVLHRLTDWPGIHTCIITCFFVSLDTIGETVHKAVLRIGGCLIGGSLAIGTILLLMPVMTDLTDLLLVLALVTFLAGWIASGSERISYAGLQIGLAFYLGILQDYGPTLNMETARDRMVGILLGNIVIYIVFTSIWPVGVSSVVRPAVAKALQQLSVMLRRSTQPSPAGVADTPDPFLAFDTAMTQARQLLVNNTYEAPGPETQRLLAILMKVQRLMVPISVITDFHRDVVSASVSPPPSREIAYQVEIAAWLDRCADWVQGEQANRGTRINLAAVPRLGDMPPLENPPAQFAAHLYWYERLHEDVISIISQINASSSDSSAIAHHSYISSPSPSAIP